MDGTLFSSRRPSAARMDGADPKDGMWSTRQAGVRSERGHAQSQLHGHVCAEVVEHSGDGVQGSETASSGFRS